MALNLIPPGGRKGNKSYLARGSVNGRVEERSLRTTDEKLARRRLRELEERLSTASPARSIVTFADAARQYVEFRSPAVVERKRIERICAQIGRRAINDIRPVDLHDLARRLLPTSQAATRNRNVLRPAITILHYAANAGLCEWIRVATFKEPRPKTRAVDLDVAARLVDAAESDAQKRLLVWLFLVGSRISDCLRVQWRQVDIAAATVQLHVGKTDQEGMFTLHPTVVAELERVPEAERVGPVFPWSNRRSVYYWLRPLCERAGVTFTPHMARHTLGTQLASTGASLKTIMQALGHASAVSSLRYQAPDIEVVRAAVNRIEIPRRIG